jgi:ubiquitin conjugation factor E4 B
VTDSLTPYLILDPEDDRGICIDFLTEAVSRFNEDDTAKSMLVKAFAGVSNQLSNMTMNDDYKPYVQVCAITRRMSFLLTSVIGFEELLAVSTFSNCYRGRSSFSNGRIDAFH